MQATKLGDGTANQLDTSWRLRLEVVDALFAAKGVNDKTAQAKALGLHRSHWNRIRDGKVTPAVSVTLDCAALLGTTVDALYRRT